jgi:hypothetical protein
MKCPGCGEAKLVRDRREMTYTYKGETTSSLNRGRRPWPASSARPGAVPPAPTFQKLNLPWAPSQLPFRPSRRQ